ncbi:EamA family transporter RarD [Synoicihabitans lomoniglobus]|uniref:EamA family transporter RarD n=1 Tax=Synoicihabitans lomoniglobus TaxID=2909285 RepID=A0AAF0CM78_9BACT|nr:EamA family transporter RarD [Opitutaceae bacterium LMO-M01]WED63738.1 EamA family transporter RarD [Opitutaceae bacterium LMO-M01]
MRDLKTTSPSISDPSQAGVAAAAVSYFLWGILPIYWKLLDGISMVELLAHRMVWTLTAVLIFQTVRGRLSGLRDTWADPVSRRAHLKNSALLSANWGLYVWAVGQGRIIETSLGYFLVPLLNVALGRLWFGERLRRAQKVAIGFAAAGVTLLIVQVNTVPWIALGLAATWASYGLVRKQSHASPLNGLALETTFAAPIALGFIGWLTASGGAAFGNTSPSATLLMVGTGVISMVPLTLFAYGARRLKFTTLGLLQYLAPTCQFLIGWLVYREPFSLDRAAAFGLIWIGLACYTIDAVRASRRPLSPV